MFYNSDRKIFVEKWRVILMCAALGATLVNGVPALKFKLEPSDVTVLIGRPAILDCIVETTDDSYGEMQIRWRGEDLSSYFDERDARKKLLNNGSLYIPHVTSEEQGSYQCVASLGLVGSLASRIARISVAGTPSVVNQPQDLRVFPGQTAHFSCMLNGPLKYDINWLKDERKLVLDETRMVIMPSGSLEIDEVLLSDYGSYRCNATSMGLHKLSNKAILTIDTESDAKSNIMAPVFITTPKSVIVKEGETVTLDCAANGNPRPWLMWLKDGSTIDMADLDSRFIKVGTGSLKIINIQESDAGTYQCRAENKEDSVDATASIDVQVPPKFNKTPQDTIAYERQEIEINCEVKGKPEPKIQWLKNGEIITVNDYLQLVNGHNLKILGVMAMDAGIFQCFASNPAGNIQSSARLTILQTADSTKTKKLNIFSKSPNILKSDDSQDEYDDTDDYDDSISYHFDADESKKEKLPPKKYSNPDKISPQYFSTLENLGTLNPSEFDSSSVDELVPSQPLDLKSTFASLRFITLTWNPPERTNGEITGYSIFYRQEGSQRERVVNKTSSRVDSINIPNLQPDRLYHFRVVAHNSNGPGLSSEDLSVATVAEVHVPGPPTNLQVEALSPTSISVMWKSPSLTNGPVLNYKLFYLENDSPEERYIVTSDLSYTLTGLKKFTEYSVWVIAHNANGPGSSSEEVVIKTQSDLPSQPPSNVTAEAASSTSIIIRWEPPPKDGQNGVITGYKLRYRKQNRRGKGDTVTAAGDRRLYVVLNLDRHSTYQVRLSAMNVNGTGPATEWITVDTYENDLDETQVPNQPSSFEARTSSKSIRVSWAPPAVQKIMVRGYTIGWGKGIPDVYTQLLDGKQRAFNIENLEQNSEYVISLRAFNEIGDGRPVYVSVKTREEPVPEPQTPLIPPVGLKAIVLSATTVVLYWTDMTLGKSQFVNDNRYYTVRFTSAHHNPNPRFKYLNSTNLNCMVVDLKPHTQYEFTVQVIKGRRESKWSMVVFNTTFEASPSSPPRDLTVVPVEGNPTSVNLNWQPPKLANGVITGYVIFYSTDPSLKDRDWVLQNLEGDKMTYVVKNLEPLMTYYFKIQARNRKGSGPLSNVASFTTGERVTLLHDNSLFSRDGRSVPNMIYIILGCCIAVASVVALTVIIVCCKRASARQHNSGSYIKSNLKPKTNMKPPDLWIHHDQMELKALEKSHQSNSDLGPSSSGSQMNTLPRTTSNQQSDFDHTSSLDKRTYLPSYVGTQDQEKTSTIKRNMKPKPISLPMEPLSIAQPVMTSNSGLSQSPGSDLGRPLYPRTQYRTHIALDSSSTMENPYSMQGGYDSIASCPPSSIITSNPIGYSSGGSVVSCTNPSTLPSQTSLQQPMSSSVSGDSNGTLGKRQQGHPLKSFSVPAPPPQSAPSTPQQKHVVRPLQGSSPYKKPGPHGIIATGSPNNTKLRTGPGTAEETVRLQPSYSTEELNQEMANLEGLMKDLNAITASEFEC